MYNITKETRKYLKNKPLHTIEVEDLASSAYDITKEYLGNCRAADRVSFMTGFSIACTILSIAGIDANTILANYPEDHSPLIEHLKH